ncbi:Hypothetical protein PSM36_1197 [Proteiniphilum saccharofermentans]|jgi:hypothetical protein|uniref:Uncharacterized protein n=1 Tax=Proteiniphilum saccharofermentans TaxID=1642647 RepID=A0A1R3SWY0_9BACT|nr:Hypothetical protein PSM36_1197 [Proteiniphilum saccharofermentans]
MERRNKHWRIEQRNRVYKAKMKLFASYGGIFILNNERVTNPRWIELYKANWSPVYKSVRTPCSCRMCRGEIYNRCAYKKETIRLIEEII